VFARSHHRGFPVVEAGGLVGMITETDLTRASQQQRVGAVLIQDLMTTQLITIHPTTSLIRVVHLLNEHQISRLPVTVKDKLVGIITRADIIRAESDSAIGETGSDVFSQEPSYVAYQTRGTITGQGRLLVSLSNPQTSELLLRLAMAIAHKRNYELECLQVLQVPRHQRPAETSIDLLQHRELLDHAIRLGQRWQLSIHTQLRLAHDVSQAMLEAIRDEHIDLMLMGWKGQTSTPDRIWGDIVDTMVRRASCDLVLVKLTSKQLPPMPFREASGVSSLMQVLSWRRWLVAIAGGSNTHYVLKLLPSLISLSRDPEVYLCQVFSPHDPIDKTGLEQAANLLQQQFHLNIRVVPVVSDNVAEALVDAAAKTPADVIVLGASQDALLRQVIQGNIPQRVAARSQCNVMMLRKALD
jgi:chloride channel protein, CIC family